MRKLMTAWLIVSLFVLPCLLNLEHLGACVFFVANLLASVVANVKCNPSIFGK